MALRDPTHFALPSKDPVVIAARQSLAVYATTIFELRCIQSRSKGAVASKRTFLKQAHFEWSKWTKDHPNGGSSDALMESLMHSTIYSYFTQLVPPSQRRTNADDSGMSSAASAT